MMAHPCTVCLGELTQRFYKMFSDSSQATGLFCRCLAVQANRGTFRKHIIKPSGRVADTTETLSSTTSTVTLFSCPQNLTRLLSTILRSVASASTRPPNPLGPGTETSPPGRGRREPCSSRLHLSRSSPATRAKLFCEVFP